MHLLILFCVVFLIALQGSILCSLFLIYIKSYSIVTTVKQLAASDILLSLAICQNFSWQIKPRYKCKSEIHPYAIQSRSELGSKSYIFMENDKIISLTNLFQHLLSAETLFKWKIEFILPYLVRNFKINVRYKLTTKCLLTFSHYTRPHLEYGS